MAAPTRCPRCHGDAMIFVAESTVSKLEPRLGETPVEFGQRVAVLRNTAFPCPLCNGELFAAYKGGHLSRTHDRHDCAVCADLFGPPPRIDP